MNLILSVRRRLNVAQNFDGVWRRSNWHPWDDPEMQSNSCGSVVPSGHLPSFLQWLKTEEVTEMYLRIGELSKSGIMGTNDE